MVGEQIKIAKNGVFIWDSEEDDWTDISLTSLVQFLQNPVQIEEGVIFEDLFKILERHADEYNLVFSSHLGHFPLSSYLEDINKECPIDDRSDICYLELQWSASLFDYHKFNQMYPDPENFPNDSVPEIPEITICADFHGWGEWKDDNIREEDKPYYGGIAIEFTALRKLKHLPLKLNKSFILYDETDENKVLAQGQRDFSVYEMLGAILYEISFAGTPDARDEKWNEIEESAEEMINKIKKEGEKNE